MCDRASAERRSEQGRAAELCLEFLQGLQSCWTGAHPEQSWSLAVFRYRGLFHLLVCQPGSGTRWQSPGAELEGSKERLLPWLELAPDRTVQVFYQKR